jgi:UDP-2,4-diacetamido-2,4,6-trideoxy-beta-L-altropyranose hydrolase
MSGSSVCVRADASTAVGAGHVTRCTALALAMRDAGASVVFVSRRLPGDSIEHVRFLGFEVQALSERFSNLTPEDPEETITALGGSVPDLLVVDSYELSVGWETDMRGRGACVVAIDDAGQRAHDCDVLLDQNAIADDGGASDPYRALAASGTRLLLGPHFALLRPEFALMHEALKPRDGIVHRVLVSFGGSDPGNGTELALKALAPLANRGLEVDVVIGGQNPNLGPCELLAAQVGARLYVDTNRMAELMAAADLAIGAAGSTTWERCCLGLPSIAFSAAANQDGIALEVARIGALCFAGLLEEASVEGLTRLLEELLGDTAVLTSMSSCGLALVDGRGASRVASALLGGCAP